MGGNCFHLAVYLTALLCVPYVSSNSEMRYSNGQNSMANPRNNPCSSVVCQNGGYCDTLLSGRPQCVCPTGYTGPSCQYQARDSDLCNNYRCENGGSCATDENGQAHCHCARGYSGSRCETGGVTQPPQSITNLRCDSACSTATVCRICLPCDSCQYQTTCLEYEILIKSLDAECHAQGYQEALLMRSPSSRVGYSPIKCRGPGPTRECPQGSSCVDDGNGGATCCRNRVGREQLENKQGSCPARSEPQTCGRLSCQGDIDCAGNLKCCSRCGNRCTNPNNNSSIPIERDVDSCDNYRCENGGFCAKRNNAKPYCRCPNGFTGSRCESRQDPCQNFQCLNQGYCQVVNGEPSCRCPRDYRGPRCGIRDDPCQNFRCENRGTCITRGDEPFCQCPTGFRGPRCGIRSDPCDSYNCLNGGYCVENRGEPSCRCPSEYTGPKCGNRNADPCDTVRCIYGRCFARGSQAHCQCSQGYTGQFCDTPLAVSRDPCQNLQCMNGGFCRSQGNSASCQCSRGYSGSRCEIRDRASQTTQGSIICQGIGCTNNRPNDQCGGCPYGWTCQYISAGCPTLNCPTPGAYRCVSINKKK